MRLKSRLPPTQPSPTRGEGLRLFQKGRGHIPSPWTGEGVRR